MSPFKMTRRLAAFEGGFSIGGTNMSNVPNPSNLGVIVKNAKARSFIYGAYVVALIGAGASQVAYAALELGQPDWLVASLAVLAYLGIPVGTLAVANTGNAQ